MSSLIVRIPRDDPLRRSVRNLFPSVIVDQFAALLLGIVNTILAGHVSSIAVAGIGQVNAISDILVLMFNSLAIGGTITVAQAWGRHDAEAANRCATQSVTWGTLAAAVIGILCCLLRDPLLKLLYPTVEKAVMDASSDYFFWIALSIPFSFLLTQCGGALRGAGDAKTPMRVNIFVNVMNLAAGYLLIIGVGPFGGLDALGAGLATFLSRALGALWILRSMLRYSSVVRFDARHALRPDGRIIKECLSLGAPAAFETLLFYIGRLFLQIAVSNMGTVSISANQVANSALSTLLILETSLQTVLMTVIGNSVGEENIEGCRRAQKYIMQLSMLVLIIPMILGIAAPEWACAIFTNDKAILTEAASALRVGCYGFVPLHPIAFVLPCGFRAAGDVKFSLIVSTISMWLFRVGFVFAVCVPLGWGLSSLWIAYLLDWLVRGAIFFFYDRAGRWLHKVPGYDVWRQNRKNARKPAHEYVK